MRFPFLLRKEVVDSYVRDNFTRIADYFRNNALDRCDFKMVEVTTTAAVTATLYPHNLGFKPADAFVTYSSSGTVTLIYGSFTETHICVTTSAATTFRLLIGKYSNG